MPRKSTKPPVLSSPGRRGHANVPRTWAQCIEWRLKIARIDARQAERDRADPWAKKIHSLIVGRRYGQRIMRVPPKHPRVTQPPPKDWRECIRRQKRKMDAEVASARLSPWDKVVRRKITALCIRSRVSQWRILMNVNQKQLKDQLERQQYRCAITGRPLSPETATIDHVVPLNRGGRHEIENLCFVHADVNRAKGTLTTQEFAVLCAEVVMHIGSPHADRTLPAAQSWEQWTGQQMAAIETLSQPKEQSHA